MLDEAQFLSPHGIRSLSRHHADHPYEVEIGGERLTVDYMPGESDTGMFGGNSNWRGPVWWTALAATLVDDRHRRGSSMF